MTELSWTRDWLDYYPGSRWDAQPLTVKEIVPARYGFRAIVKHVPDQAFAIDEQLYRRLGRRFEAELGLWSASDVSVWPPHLDAAAT